MTTSTTPPSLDSVVGNLNTAFDLLQKLAALPATAPGAAAPRTSPRTPPGQPTPPKLTADDLLQLTVFAEEVDDILRRVAALKIRLERP
jgi:hypothetical protein